MSTSIVESETPGRLRLRLPKGIRHKGIEEDIRTLMVECKGVSEVATNPGTGSILVEYDPARLDSQRMDEISRAVDDLTTSATERVQAEIRAYNEVSLAAKQIVRTFRRIDSFVNRATRGTVDAKVLGPLLLVGLSAGRALLDAERPRTPWYTLLWYGYSSFLHWNKPGDIAD